MLSKIMPINPTPKKQNVAQMIVEKAKKNYPNKRLGRCCINLFCIWATSVSTNATIPSFIGDAQDIIDFKVSASAFQVVSNELSTLTDPACATTIDMD